MVHSLSPIGIAHTLVSLVPLVAGIYSFIRYRKIDTSNSAGKTYLFSLVLAVVTSFGVSSTGGINAGHIFGLIILAIVFGGIFATKLAFLGRLRPYIYTFALSFSFFLSLVPGTNETLTRLPVAHPLASAPMSPLVLHVILGWLALFVVGFAAQCWALYANNRATA
ncbi:hypothetical protein [Gallaecimonas mangrovi]|uniref:hypothetical protein n=1 Tax=Gallaecimonas mangrovi TaxID=2291597 RepID=UPI000E1FCAA5|nr:hypothetical protein [Gallaecimonas mangrovi]